MDRTSNRNIDKAGKEHWNSTERNQHVDMGAFAPDVGVRNVAKRMWHEMFESAIGGTAHTTQKVLELGCGGSAFLPYFAHQFGFDVSGIDYSESGCDLARQMCVANNISARVVCADFFHAPAEMMESFDVVASFGVVEHFSDTTYTLSRFAGFLKREG